jgi:FliI/YscN family ATPase
MPLGDTEGVRSGTVVYPLGRPLAVEGGDGMVGRVLDGLGRPLDDGGPVRDPVTIPVTAAPPNPLERARVTQALGTGVRAIDGLLTLGRGQRMGIFAGSGVGKSVLLGMVAQRTTADINVIALLGERGREVRDFIERDLGSEGLKRSVVVVATSDQPAIVRAKGALVATAIAEHFRNSGRHVLLMVDSLTRVMMAWREIGLAVGEPPTTRGYPPSAFAQLPKLLERAGNGVVGSITGLYTVLVDGDDFNEPVADAARSILDGHIVLDRRLATAGQFPAIEPLDSVSRVRDDIISEEHLRSAGTFLRLRAAYRCHEDLIAVGAYRFGTVPDVDRAIALREEMMAFLRQRPEVGSTLDEARSALHLLARRAGEGNGVERR